MALGSITATGSIVSAVGIKKLITASGIDVTKVDEAGQKDTIIASLLGQITQLDGQVTGTPLSANESERKVWLGSFLTELAKQKAELPNAVAAEKTHALISQHIAKIHQLSGDTVVTSDLELQGGELVSGQALDKLSLEGWKIESIDGGKKIKITVDKSKIQTGTEKTMDVKIKLQDGTESIYKIGVKYTVAAAPATPSLNQVAKIDDPKTGTVYETTITLPDGYKFEKKDGAVKLGDGLTLDSTEALEDGKKAKVKYKINELKDSDRDMGITILAKGPPNGVGSETELKGSIKVAKKKAKEGNFFTNHLWGWIGGIVAVLGLGFLGWSNKDSGEDGMGKSLVPAAIVGVGGLLLGKEFFGGEKEPAKPK